MIMAVDAVRKQASSQIPQSFSLPPRRPEDDDLTYCRTVHAALYDEKVSDKAREEYLDTIRLRIQLLVTRQQRLLEEFLNALGIYDPQIKKHNKEFFPFPTPEKLHKMAQVLQTPVERLLDVRTPLFPRYREKGQAIRDAIAAYPVGQRFTVAQVREQPGCSVNRSSIGNVLRKLREEGMVELLYEGRYSIWKRLSISNSPTKKKTDKSQMIREHVEAYREGRRFTFNELVAHFGEDVSQSTIARVLRQLKLQGVIKQTGIADNAFWEKVAVVGNGKSGRITVLEDHFNVKETKQRGVLEVLEHYPVGAEFKRAELKAAIPSDVSESLLDRVLQNMRHLELLEQSGTGSEARWVKTAKFIISR